MNSDEPSTAGQADYGIAELLTKRDWPEINLILSQFDIGIEEMWGGNDKRAYALEMMRFSRDDNALHELHQYLTGHGELEGIASGPQPWREDGLRLFLSHLAISERNWASRTASLCMASTPSSRTPASRLPQNGKTLLKMRFVAVTLWLCS